MKSKAIHISEVLRLMNHALLNHQQVDIKAWKLGASETDPERGEVKTYNGHYVTSHSKTGVYRLLDPLAESEAFKYRRVPEVFITEFMGKKVYW